MAKSVFDIPDDEFLKMPFLPEELEKSSQENEEEESSNAPEDNQETETNTNPEENNSEEVSEDQPEEQDQNDDDSSGSEEPSEVDQDTNDDVFKGDDKSDSPQTKEETSKTKASPNYEDFYLKVTAPFKANGKSVQFDNAEDVISLMQRGIDYTKKTQDLAKHKKSILMLQKADLLSEDKISFLIDIANGEQEAIRKLLKEKDIDAFSLPSDDTPIEYTPGANIMTDNQVYLAELDERIRTAPQGAEFISFINNLDPTSREILAQQPAAIEELFTQKQNGTFDLVYSSMEKERMLGRINPNTSFVEAYYNTIRKLANSAPQNQKTNTAPITRKLAGLTTNNRYNNSQRAKSAGITRTSPKYVEDTISPLCMSDEEYIAKFGLR